ncbi:hypothetical protein LRP88_10636 [Fusarium phalaenopsidis]
MWLPEQRMPVTTEVRIELIVNCIVVLIVSIVVALGVIGRLWGPGLGLDDVLVMLATVMLPNVPWILHVSFGMQPVYITLLALCKASMLCSFLRIFPTRFMQWSSKIALGFVIAWNIACVFASIFLCNPVSAQWTGQGKCGAYIPFIQSLIATNAVGDIIIMALPMHSLWNLQKRTVEKLAIMSCFGLGTACVVCAVGESYAGFNSLRLFRKDYLEGHPARVEKVTGQPYCCEASGTKFVNNPIPTLSNKSPRWTG